MLQLENGGYLLAYSNSSDGGSTSSILIREMNSSGESVTEDFEVSSNSSLLNQAPKLALSENDLIVTWVSSGIDGSGNGIAGQRLLLNNSSASIGELTAARSMITNVDTALQTLNSQRASLGALSNRLDHIIANNTNASTNTKASLGRIQDADFAAETTKLAKSKILEQSSTAMLAQANASVYEVLTLIPD
jgi:flagellin